MPHARLRFVAAGAAAVTGLAGLALAPGVAQGAGHGEGSYNVKTPTSTGYGGAVTSVDPGADVADDRVGVADQRDPAAPLARGRQARGSGAGGAPALCRGSPGHQPTLTAEGWSKVVETAPGHLSTVRHNVIDALDRRQVKQLRDICESILERIDPDGTRTAPYRRPS